MQLLIIYGKKGFKMLKFEYVIYIFFIFAVTANAKENFTNVDIIGKMACISSDGIPDHKIGKFPNQANPNKLKEQSITFCFPATPRLTENVTWGLMTVGVSTNGIPIRPYTAEYFDPNTEKGYSKNPSSGLRKQAMYNPRSLGMDAHNGHVDRSGLYHYHSIAKSLIDKKKDLLIGYAPDGFQIVYSPSGITSSWQLKSGSRSFPPGGVRNGQFEEDYEYRMNSGSLDECNGSRINGVYTYFATTSYPFFPRCFKGDVNVDFMVRN